ncbi:MAG: hypothetical protein WBP81_21485 [Solirubrobacteraceae bacterium]
MGLRRHHGLGVLTATPQTPGVLIHGRPAGVGPRDQVTADAGIAQRTWAEPARPRSAPESPPFGPAGGSSLIGPQTAWPGIEESPPTGVLPVIALATASMQ